MNKIAILVLGVFSVFGLYAQNNTVSKGRVITLQEVTVYPKKGLSIIKSNNKKKIHIKGKGNTCLVTKTDIDKKIVYKLMGIEFFFNYKWQGIDEEGFYIRPLILTSEKGKPHLDLLNSQT